MEVFNIDITVLTLNNSFKIKRTHSNNLRKWPESCTQTHHLIMADIYYKDVCQIHHSR